MPDREGLESCAGCRHRYRLERADYSKGGCEHTDMEGYVCMAFADEGLAVWMVGSDETKGMCECYEEVMAVGHETVSDQ